VKSLKAFNLEELISPSVLDTGELIFFLENVDWERVKEGVESFGFGLAYTHTAGPNLILTVNGIHLGIPLSSPEVVRALDKKEFYLALNREVNGKYEVLKVDYPVEFLYYARGVMDTLEVIREEAEKLLKGK